MQGQKTLVRNRKQSAPTRIVGWLDPPSGIYHAQPLSGWYSDLGDMLQSSQKHTNPHHCQQLESETALEFLAHSD